MKPGMFFTEKALTDSVNKAVEKTLKEPRGANAFGTELQTAMDWFALTLPSSLQSDRITTKETLPFSRKVTVTAIPDQDQNKKTSHPLVKESREGKLILSQPIFYTVQKGDTLSEISWKLTGRRASVGDLKNWNTLWTDLIKPGQLLYLADPNDSFVKEISSKYSKNELASRNPKISLDRLSGKMVARHGGLFGGEHQVEILLEFKESPEDFLNPEIFGKEPVQQIPWAPGFAGGNGMGNNFDRPYYPDEVRLSGGDFPSKKKESNERGWYGHAANVITGTSVLSGAISGTEDAITIANMKKLNDLGFDATQAIKQLAKDGLDLPQPMKNFRLAPGTSRFSKLVNLARPVGTVGGVIGVGFSANNIITDYSNGGINQVNNWDMVDLLAGLSGLVAVIFYATNPIGWVVGGAVTIYFGIRLVHDLSSGN